MDNLDIKIGKSESKRIYEDIELMFDQTLEEIELQLSNIECKMNNLNKEAESTLKKGNKNGAKRILREKKNYEEVKNSIGETLQLLEEQIIIFNTSNKNEEIINIIKQTNKQIKEKIYFIISDLTNEEEHIFQSIKDKENKLDAIESKAKELEEKEKSYLKENNISEAKKILLEKNNLIKTIETMEKEINELKEGIINKRKEAFNEMNNIIKQDNQKIKEVNEQKKEDFKIKNNELNNPLIEKNKELVEENNKLKKLIEQLKEDNLKKVQTLEKENNEQKEKINSLEKEIQNIMIQNNNLNENIIISKSSGEKIISINFMTMGNQDIINYSMPCKTTDLFVRLEEKLYNDFPKYKNYEVYFEVNTRRIKRFQTVEENKIKSNDLISIFIIEE